MLRKTVPNYKIDLEKAAKQMILIHRVDTLIKLILRTIIRNLRVKHAGLLLYDKPRDEYIIKVSRGGGAKVPAGLAKVKKDNPLIQYFTNEKLCIFGKEYIFLDKLNSFLRSKKGINNRKFFENLQLQFSLYDIKACIPGFFRNDLICIFLLGDKLDHKKITKEELSFLSVLSSDAVMAIKNAWLFQDLNNQLQLNRSLFLQTVKAFASAIEAKDEYTLGHTERVSKYSLAVAKEIQSMKSDLYKDWNKFFEDLRIASLLHDIGKIGTSESILNKDGPLTKEEFKQVQNHPVVGFSILEQVDEFKVPILGVKYHHERYDGAGYPEGLIGAKIPLIAQIIAVSDAFDAMTSDRPYRKRLTNEAAIKIIKDNRGKQFSPLVVDAFLKAYARKAIC